LSALHSRCDDLDTRQVLLENLIDEERGAGNHPALWLKFAQGARTHPRRGAGGRAAAGGQCAASSTLKVSDATFFEASLPELTTKAATTAPHQAFECEDQRYIAIGVERDEQWPGFCRALPRSRRLKRSRKSIILPPAASKRCVRSRAFRKPRTRSRMPPPTLGQHTEEVLRAAGLGAPEPKG
jgi:CoA-transferase family III